MKRISKESLENIGFTFKKLEHELFKDFKPNWESYMSPDKRYSVSRDLDGNNISYEDAWNLHVDNSDMQTIASCSVEYIEQIQAIMEIYKDY